MTVRLAVAAVAVSIVAVACSSDDETMTNGAHEHEHGSSTAATFDDADATTGIEVHMADFDFVGLPEGVQGPRVLFRLKVEAGEHEFIVEDEKGNEKGGIAPFSPGPTKKLKLELPAGTYTLVCNVKEGAKTHAELGMKRTLIVT